MTRLKDTRLWSFFSSLLNRETGLRRLAFEIQITVSFQAERKTQCFLGPSSLTKQKRFLITIHNVLLTAAAKNHDRPARPLSSDSATKITADGWLKSSRSIIIYDRYIFTAELSVTAIVSQRYHHLHSFPSFVDTTPIGTNVMFVINIVPLRRPVCPFLQPQPLSCINENSDSFVNTAVNL